MELNLNEASRSELESNLEPFGDNSNVIMDVTGQNRVSAEGSMMMLEPRLENVNAVAVLEPEDKKADERVDVVENSSGERPLEFYRDYFGESANIVITPLEFEGIEECVEDVQYLEHELRISPEFGHGQTRFGTGIENNFIRSRDVQEAIDELDDEIGFQVIFSYRGDDQASETFRDYMDGNSLFAGETDGVTGIVSIGRSEFPEVYMAGPRDLDVDMPELPGYSDSLKIGHVYELM